jgi:hypothetical protein
MKGKLNIFKTGILLLALVLSASAASALPDLQVSGISVKHNTYDGAWANLSNTVNVTAVNNGADGAGSFNVTLYADSVLVDKKPVSGLDAGASTVVGFDWTPMTAKTYILRAVADPENAVAESDETNNESTISQPVLNNGYTGDKPFTTYAHGRMKGDLSYTIGDSKYGGKLFPKQPMPPGNDPKYTVNFTVTLPVGATVKSARLYSYWTWSGTGSTGKYPIMNLTFDGAEISPEVKYDDRKGWGAVYDYPSGTWAYNVTSLVTGSGSHKAIVRNIDTDTKAFFAMDGIGLLILYEDGGNEVEYWINEGADMLSTQGDTSGGLTPQEATARSLFSGSIDPSKVEGARLWTVVQSGGNPGNMLLFNDMTWSGVYDGTPYPDLDIDEARSVKDNLVASDNLAHIRGAPSLGGGDYLVPSNAFLVVNYSQVPMLSLSASPTTVFVGIPTDVNFTVTSDSAKISGAMVTLSGSATGSGTTDANGSVKINVNATEAGTITAKASKTGYINASTTLIASVKHGGASSSVSLGADIMPAISLVVTPNAIDFGELSPGETSGVHTLTLNNTGGYGVSVTAEVNDTASNLFVNGLLLDSNAWSAYTTSIASAGSKPAGASLKVPSDYAGVGAKEGTLVFWAQKS